MGLALILLWEEYQLDFGSSQNDRNSHFCETCMLFAKMLTRSMLQNRRFGEKLFIDFAGPTIAPTGLANPCVCGNLWRIVLYVCMRHAAQDEVRLDQIEVQGTGLIW